MWPGRQTLAGSSGVGLTTPPRGHTLYGMQVRILVGLPAAAVLGWYLGPIAERLARRGICRRVTFYAGWSALVLAIAVAGWLEGPDITDVMATLAGMSFALRAWQCRDDDKRSRRRHTTGVST